MLGFTWLLFVSFATPPPTLTYRRPQRLNLFHHPPHPSSRVRHANKPRSPDTSHQTHRRDRLEEVCHIVMAASVQHGVVRRDGILRVLAGRWLKQVYEFVAVFSVYEMGFFCYEVMHVKKILKLPPELI